MSFWLRDTRRALPPSRKATERYPSHLISNSHCGLSKGSSTSVASMGWITVGMAAFRAPGVFSKSFNAEDAEETFNVEFAEVIGFFFDLLKTPEVFAWSSSGLELLLVVCFSSALSALIFCFFLSALAMASASQAFPGDLAAGRLLFHSFAPSSPAIWSRLRWLSTE